MTWKGNGRSAGGVTDPTVYTGLLGTAFTCLRSYEATGDPKDLELCSEIVDACAELARTVTRFLLFALFILLNQFNPNTELNG